MNDEQSTPVTMKQLEKLLEVVAQKKDHRWLTIRTATSYADLSDKSIRRLIGRGKLTAYRPVKGRILIDRFELDQHIASTVRRRHGRTAP